MNRIKIACVLFIAFCILFCSSCGMYSRNSEETAPVSTETAESSGMSVIESLDPTDIDSSEMPIIKFSIPTEVNSSGMPISEILDSSDITKYCEEEFTHDEIPDDLLQAFASSISSEELQIVKKAWINAPSKVIRGVEAHIYVLLRALQNTENSDIEITSAKFVPYAVEECFIEMEKTFGCDGYALQITDDSDNIYLVWDGFVYEKVICNRETIYLKNHVVF